jgi:hypothetical protein
VLAPRSILAIFDIYDAIDDGTLFFLGHPGPLGDLLASAVTTLADIVLDDAYANARIWNELHLGFRDRSITWTVDPSLDSIYELLREAHHSNRSHRLSDNYGPGHVPELSAKSIYWDHDGGPRIVSSVLSRKCWPRGVYRILNRMWKPRMNTGSPFSIDPGFGKMIVDQLSFCEELGARAVFMSRQTDGGWQRWAADGFGEQTGLSFHLPEDSFLTCDNEDDVSCWQRIMLCGPTDVLDSWKRRTVKWR